MVPPIWVDERGGRRQTRPCDKCGREAPVYRFRISDLRRMGWRLFAPADFVNWCGHQQPFVPLPERGGRTRLVPVVGNTN